VEVGAFWRVAATAVPLQREAQVYTRATRTRALFCYVDTYMYLSTFESDQL